MGFDTSRLTNNVSVETAADASRISQSTRVIRGPAPAGDAVPGNVLRVGENAKAENIQQTLVYIESDRDYYFALEIMDEQGNAILDSALDPGSTYIIRAQASLNPVLGSKQTRKIESEATLELQTAAGCVDAAVTSGALRAGNPLSQSVEFKFTVRLDCGVQEFSLDLIFYETSLKSQRAAVTSRDINVNITAITKQLVAQTFGIQIAEDAPSGTGFCYVQPVDDSKLKLVFFLNKEKPKTFHIDRMTRVNPTNGGLVKYLKELYDGHIAYFESLSPELYQWLQAKTSAAGELLSILLFDDADSRIPWELATFSPGRHLGAQIRMIRGLRVHYGDASTPLAFGEQRLVGQAVHLLSAASTAFEGWGAPIEDPEELFDALNLEPPVSLVCIALDSIIHTSGLPAEFATLAGGKTLKIDFGFGDDPPQRPLFVVAAPHSAWIAGKGKQAAGLPHALLDKAGSAVIGTLCLVDPQDALDIAMHFFTLAKEAAGFCPAEAIRQLRAEAEKEIALSRDKKYGDLAKRQALFRRAVTKLMLVYYGPPNLTVRLEPLAASPEEDEEGGDGGN